MQKATLTRLLNELNDAAQQFAAVRNPATQHAYFTALRAMEQAIAALWTGRPAKAETFLVTFRGSGAVEQYNNLGALAARIGLSPATIRTRLSQGKGTHYMSLAERKGGDADSAIIQRIGWTPGKGRPRHERPDQP